MKNIKDLRDQYKNVRLTKEELRILKEYAEKSGMKVSEYMRNKLFN